MILSVAVLVPPVAFPGFSAGKTLKKVGMGLQLHHALSGTKTVEKGMKAGAQQLGIELEVADADLPWRNRPPWWKTSSLKASTCPRSPPVQQEGARPS